MTAPTSTSMETIVPATEAATECSIFIDSMMMTGESELTSLPTAAKTDTTVPCNGA